MIANRPAPSRAWLLVKGKRRAECTVALDSRGWEVRFEVDGDLVKSQVRKTQEEMLDEVEDGKHAFLAKGWLEPEKNATNGRLHQT